MSKMRPAKLVALIIVASVVTFFSNAQPAHAAVWSGNGGTYYGYFTNDRNPPAGLREGTCRGDEIKGYVLPVIGVERGECVALSYSVNTRDELIQFLKNNNNSGNNRKRTGSAFIVHSMLGRSGSQANSHGGRNISNADWNELADRLDDVDIDWNENLHTNTNIYMKATIDVARDISGQSGSAIIFYKKGTHQKVYALYHECANPDGDLPGLPPVDEPSWSVGVNTNVNRTSAQPGDTITWTHRITNNGPDPVSGSVSYRYENRGDLSAPADTAHAYATSRGAGQSAQYTSTYVVQPGDAGKNLCRRTAASPRSSASANTTYSGDACVRVNQTADYALTPRTELSGGGTGRSVEPGTDGIGFTYGVDNAGPDGSSDTDWELARCVFAPGAGGYDAAPDDSTDGATTYAARGANCGPSVLDGTADFPRTYTNLGERTDESVAGLALGSRLCYVLSVRKPTGTSAETVWRHSVPACVTVLKTPKIQAWSGDIKAGGIRTAASVALDGRTYGSWAEYGIFNYGTASGMGSAAVFAGGCAPAPGRTCLDITRLTFANTTTDRFAESVNEGYAEAYRDTGGAAIGSSFAGLTGGKYTRTGDLSIGGSVPAGLRAVITVTGNLRISSDIAYPDTYVSATTIPRVILVVDGNILVDPGVARIDAWLISKRTLYTCSDDVAATRARLTANDCRNKLTFNGPVYVADTRMSRTYGADETTRADAAEVFNLRPDIFISSLIGASGSSSVRTVYETELPPRW